MKVIQRLTAIPIKQHDLDKLKICYLSGLFLIKKLNI